MCIEVGNSLHILVPICPMDRITLFFMLALAQKPDLHTILLVAVECAVPTLRALAALATEESSLVRVV
jgi:hypothetical protein